ncbi:Spermidine/putrescine import ATP-binding protein PotA (plasmid) [Caballeronia sp. SBC1]|uniref:ABC transporter ATP-binding protein n=1 Tax=unclassified Caballeronia TaxID=2646786 RepID=UPI0013E12519|nr:MULTISPECIES: ABC transporter ATP-binding protein [unclassified Caballeronia]QIE28883.1 Spermidine/putrescine import ATP-binding protein PotA [Caballeronia sp. SBC2]QIN66938.1 Spermidine/putrescine import ATP-binding protein PotA [Caballeronia sp. SBC1]
MMATAVATSSPSGAERSQRLLLDGVSKRFGAVTALETMTLDVHPGELLALLGPSGCGKTTTLRLIAGFDQPDTGTVSIGGRDVTGLPPDKRGLGMVFQNYSLFPHLSVGANIGFGLRMAGTPKSEIAARVKKMLETIRLPGIEARNIAQLSGGQQQRIALARALITNPSVLLLDEPLGALDKNLREGMQFELRQIQSELGITSVMVTHDQEEALTMSDRVVVMDRGRILQTGSPRDVYEQPRTRFVAEFLGTANVIECDVIARHAQAVKLRPHRSRADVVVPLRDVRLSGDQAEFAIRPEKVVLDAPQSHHVRFDGRIVQHVFRGAHHAYRVDVAALGRPVYAYEMATSSSGGGARPAGAQVVVSFDAESAVLLETDGGPALAKAA